MPGLSPYTESYYGRNSESGSQYPVRDYGHDMYGDHRGPQKNDHYGGGAPYNDYRPGYNGDSQEPPSPTSDERPLYYTMDHLATFTVGSTQGLLFPEDGIKKLRMMESSSGIWTMRIQMTVEAKYIMVVDPTNMDEIERFPIQNVNDPKAFVSNDKKDLFNNLLIFTVTEDQKRTGQSEMHIFQCVSRSSQEAVDDIVSAKMGRHRPSSSPQRRDTHRIPPPPIEPAPMPPPSANVNGAMHVREQVDHYERRKTAGRIREDDDLDSNASSERIDREVQLLNHCFDDIEKFVNRLQMAAEAYKSLQTRQGGRSKKDRRKMGEGLLTMRSRPPPPQDFMDVFAKFKLAFNLLAKLKAHIHDPNAPELVHFLFTPLALIVEASKNNSRYEYNDLPSRVVSPLISAEAKHLLLNCLTSKETDLWMSLGEPWTVSREMWKGYVPPFIPRFMDGWQPTPSIVEDRDAISSAVANHAAQIRRQDETNRAVGQADEHVFRYERSGDHRPQYRDTVYREEITRRIEQEPIYRDSIPPPIGQQDPRNKQAHQGPAPARHASQYQPQHVPPSRPQLTYEEEQAQFLSDLQARGGRVCEVVHERQGNNAKELTIRRGELLEVLDDTRNWWKLKNSKGAIGHTPYTIVKEITNDADGPVRNGAVDNRPQVSPRGYDEHDRGFNRERPGSGVYNSTLPPAAPPAPPPPMQQQPSQIRNQRSTKKEDVDTPRKTPDKRLSKNYSGGNSVDDLNSELKRHLIAKGNGVQMRNRTPTMYITQHSTEEEVKDWLVSKGFNHRVIYAFEGQTGQDLFALSKNQLERICGYDEGQRLYSQITVQKNLSGYGTTGASELHAILQRRKERADSGDYNQSRPADNFGAAPDYAPDNFSDDSSEGYTGPGGSNTLKDMLRKRRKEILK